MTEDKPQMTPKQEAKAKAKELAAKAKAKIAAHTTALKHSGLAIKLAEKEISAGQKKLERLQKTHTALVAKG